MTRKNEGRECDVVRFAGIFKCFTHERVWGRGVKHPTLPCKRWGGKCRNVYTLKGLQTGKDDVL